MQISQRASFLIFCSTQETYAVFHNLTRQLFLYCKISFLMIQIVSRIDLEESNYLRHSKGSFKGSAHLWENKSLYDLDKFFQIKTLYNAIFFIVKLHCKNSFAIIKNFQFYPKYRVLINLGLNFGLRFQLLRQKFKLSL